MEASKYPSHHLQYRVTSPEPPPPVEYNEPVTPHPSSLSSQKKSRNTRNRSLLKESASSNVYAAKMADQFDEDIRKAQQAGAQGYIMEDQPEASRLKRSHSITNYNTNGEDSGESGCCTKVLLAISWFFIILLFPLALPMCLKVVQEYERAVIFRMGRLFKGGAKGPGLFFVIPCTDSYTKVDLRTQAFDVPPQEILSKDSVTITVDAVVYYRIQNATISIANVKDASRSTRLMAQTTLRNVLGTKNLSDILSERESIAQFMQSSLDEATDPWGVKVERVEIKDVRLPKQLQRAMAAEAESARDAKAKVIAAEGEHNASRALRAAADVIEGSSSALQLRFLQTLTAIAAEKNSTIIFPLPMDLLKGFMKNKTD